MEKITVLGAGAGGCATAVILTKKGYSVTLWNRPGSGMQAIMQKEGVECHGDIEGFIRINEITHDIEKAVKGTRFILITVPAFAQREVAELCAPHLDDGQIVLLNPGSAGSLEFAMVLRDKGVNRDVIIGESITLALGGGRVLGPGVIRIRSYEKWVKRSAAFPAKRTEEMIGILGKICNLKPAKTVLEVGLLNVNFMIHPVPTILNMGWAELNPLFNPYHDGISPSVLRCMEQLDMEKQNILKSLGLEPISCDELYRNEFGVSEGIPQRWVPPPGGWTKEEEKKRGRGWEERYITEDIQYGLVLISSLGHQFGIPTPLADAMVELGSVIRKTDLRKKGRVLEKLGLSGLNADQINRFLYEGEL